ncbi:alpha/beta fold hydrolase, partial [Mogibacterium pumilum]|uniref:alpha/beta fold hydrolase n=1 Tax=Mogibacterium pumilum TaxID=86332 RepID=UPI000B92D71A
MKNDVKNCHNAYPTIVDVSKSINLCHAQLPADIKILKENTYDEHMDTANKLWRKHHVKQGDFIAYDGLTIRYYHAAQQESAKGCIVMLHGYCGFWGKFHEMAEYYWHAGYEVFFMEHRGHGYSGRQIEGDDIVHVNSYNDYTRDLHQFMTEVVKPHIGDIACIMFAHSMGGAIGVLYLEQHPGIFDAAILSSPMFKIRTGGTSLLMIKFLLAKIKLLRQEKLPFPGGKHWDGVSTDGKSSAMSEPRYT